MKFSSTVSQWVELRCSLPLIWADPVAEWLLAEETSGVVLEEAEGASPGPEDKVSLLTAFPAEVDVETVIAKLRSLGNDLARRSGLNERLVVETRLMAPKEITSFLAQSFQPVELTDGLWVVPAGDEEAARSVPPGARLIRLIPGPAFGTGQHPTTRLAARLASGRLARWRGAGGPRVMDLGTGSGLLAIAAALGGAAPVVGVEKDLLALDNARRNVEENGLAGRVALVAADLTAMRPRPWADLIIANLDRDQFLTGCPRLAGWLAPGGALVASGILSDHEGPVTGAFLEAGLAVAGRAADGPWTSYLLERRAP